MNKEIMTNEEMDVFWDECDDICVRVAKNIQSQIVQEIMESTSCKNKSLLYQGIVYEKLAVFLCAASFNIHKQIVVNKDTVTPETYMKSFTEKALMKADLMAFEMVKIKDD